MKKIRPAHDYNLFTKLVKSILMIFKKKPHIIYAEEPLPAKAIYIANHRGAAGPLTISMYFPKALVPWGAHPMTENYGKRWHYLYHIFYQQKLKYSKVRSWVLATLFAIISKLLYKGVQLIPTYTDIRLKTTMNQSLKHLEMGHSILIFPEDSEDGYHDHMTSFHAGFIYLAEKYHKRFKEHIAIVPMYYHKAKQTIYVDKAYSLGDLHHLNDRKDKAQAFKDIINAYKNKN